MTGDFNGDGRADLAVAGTSTISSIEARSRCCWGPATGRSTPRRRSAQGPRLSVRPRDGRLQRRRPRRPRRRRIRPTPAKARSRCCWGPATGRSRPRRRSARGSRSDSALVTGDFNGDGRADLAYAAPSPQVALSLGNGEFAPPSEFTGAIHDNPLVADPGDGSTMSSSSIRTATSCGARDSLRLRGASAPHHDQPRSIPRATSPSFRPVRGRCSPASISGTTRSRCTRTGAANSSRSCSCPPCTGRNNSSGSATAHPRAGRRGRPQWGWERRPGRPQRGGRDRIGLPRRRRWGLRQAGRRAPRPGHLGHRPGRPRRDGAPRSRRDQPGHRRRPRPARQRRRHLRRPFRVSRRGRTVWAEGLRRRHDRPGIAGGDGGGGDRDVHAGRDDRPRDHRSRLELARGPRRPGRRCPRQPHALPHEHTGHRRPDRGFRPRRRQRPGRARFRRPDHLPRRRPGRVRQGQDEDL